MSNANAGTPYELSTDKLTKNELAALIEHVIYRADGSTRSALAKVMPDAYQRLTNATPKTMAALTK
jgi:hypothetical protein